MRNVTIRTVLGDTRAPTRWYEDGSFDCPYCHAVVVFGRDNDQCPNPACDSRPEYKPETLQAVRDKRAAAVAEEASRKRNHELAMQRIAEDKARRDTLHAEHLAIITEKGACRRCSKPGGGQFKPVKHRAECPKERGTIYRDLGMQKVKGNLGGTYWE